MPSRLILHDNLAANLLAQNGHDVRFDDRSSLADLVWAAETSECFAAWFLRNAKNARTMAMQKVLKEK
jgi:hypothetical protein